MKVEIGPYVDWVGPYQVAGKILFWMDRDDERVARLGEFLTYGFNKKVAGSKREETYFSKFLTWVNGKRERRIKVRIDPWDTWSADKTLALVILPVLEQLKREKHGSAIVDFEDVPEEFRPSDDEIIRMEENAGWTDSKLHERWDWVMGEMIWAFQQELRDDESDFFEHPVDGDAEDFMGSIRNIKVDFDGLEAHNMRKANGFRLFGKYYQNLWE